MILNQLQTIGVSPKAGLQFRQGYGLGVQAGGVGLPREINNLEETMWQGYGLGPARICFKPQAKCIVEGIKANKLGIAKFLVKDVPPFDPARPDPVGSFKVPPSPQVSTRPPEGN